MRQLLMDKFARLQTDDTVPAPPMKRSRLSSRLETLPSELLRHTTNYITGDSGLVELHACAPCLHARPVGSCPLCLPWTLGAGEPSWAGGEEESKDQPRRRRHADGSPPRALTLTLTRTLTRTRTRWQPTAPRMCPALLGA